MTNWNEEMGDDRRLGWVEALGQALENTPESGYNFVKDLVTAVIHPWESTKAVASVGAGAVEKAVPGAGYVLPGPIYNRQNVEQFDALVEFFVNRYGTVEDWKRTIAEDPIGVLADFSTIFTALGGAARGTAQIASKAGKIPKVGAAFEKTGKGLQTAAAVTDPLQAPKLVGKGIQKAAAPFKSAYGTTFSEKLMQSAMKWTKTDVKKAQRPGESFRETAKRINRAAIDHRVTASFAGVLKVEEKIAELNKRIDGLIQTATETGASVSAGELLVHMQDLYNEMRYRPMSDTAKKQIANVIKQHDKEWGIFNDKGRLIGYQEMSAADVQKFKTSTYKKLEGSYESMRAQSPSIQAQKALARGAKDKLVEMIPEIGEVNAAYGPLKDLERAINTAAERITNRDIMGIGVPIKGGMGYAATGGEPLGVMAGLTLGFLDTPTIKSAVALLVDQLQKEGVTFRPTQAAVEMGLFQRGRITEELGEND